MWSLLQLSSTDKTATFEHTILYYTGTWGYIPHQGNFSPEANHVWSWLMAWLALRLLITDYSETLDYLQYWILSEFRKQCLADESVVIQQYNHKITSVITDSTDAFHDLQCSTPSTIVTAWEVLIVPTETAFSPKLWNLENQPPSAEKINRLSRKSNWLKTNPMVSVSQMWGFGCFAVCFLFATQKKQAICLSQLGLPELLIGIFHYFISHALINWLE